MDCPNCIDIALPAPPQPFDMATYRNISSMTILTNYCNKRRKRLSAPTWATNGAHNALWNCKIELDEETYPQTMATTAKEAQGLAAELALRCLLAGPERRDVLGCMPNYHPVFERYLLDNGIRDCIQWHDPQRSGPDHDARWTCTLTMHGVQIACATTKSRHLAAEEATKKAALTFHLWPCNQEFPAHAHADVIAIHAQSVVAPV